MDNKNPIIWGIYVVGGAIVLGATCGLISNYNDTEAANEHQAALDTPSLYHEPPSVTSIPEVTILHEDIGKNLDADIAKASRCIWYCVVANSGNGEATGDCTAQRCAKMESLGYAAINLCMNECANMKYEIDCVPLTPEDAAADKKCGKSDSCRLRYFSK